MIISHIANGSNEQLRLQLNAGSFISFLALDYDLDDLGTRLAFLSYDSTERKVMLFILSHAESFKKESILQISGWRVNKYILSEKFNKLLAIRTEIKQLKLYAQHKD